MISIHHYRLTTQIINTTSHQLISYYYFQKLMEISKEQLELTKENNPKEEEEELISDFSQMFKGKVLGKKPVLRERQAQPTPNWLLQIPAKLQITKEELCQRKVLNQKKWKAIVASSNAEQMLISSVVSAWNYLFSTKGIGTEKPLTLKQAIEICESAGTKYQTQNQFQRAQVVLNCFKSLCISGNNASESKVIIKPTYPAKIEAQQSEYLDYFLKGLSSDETFYVYITYNNIICPIGFDKTPLVPLDAFKKLQQIKSENIELWIINGSVRRFQPSFVSKRWTDVHKNLTTVWPNYVDLEEPKKGVQRMSSATQQTQKQDRGCSNCIIQFKKTVSNQ